MYLKYPSKYIVRPDPAQRRRGNRTKRTLEMAASNCGEGSNTPWMHSGTWRGFVWMSLETASESAKYDAGQKSGGCSCMASLLEGDVNGDLKVGWMVGHCDQTLESRYTRERDAVQRGLVCA